MTLAEKLSNLFTGFKIYYAIDIVLLSLVFYAIFAFLKHINSAGMIKYLIGVVIACTLVYIFRQEISATARILLAVAINGAVIFVVVYQSDFRRLLWSASAPKAYRSNYNSNFDCSDDELEDARNEIVKAVLNLAKSNTGALIVLTSKNMPSQVIESGTKLNALVSAPILESIFFPNTALHDGAVLVNGNKIVAAGCFLPLSQNFNIPKDLGTRHRAALGISEDANATSIIVSEETGIISVTRNGVLSRYYDAHMLREAIGLSFGIVATDGEKKKKKRRSKNERSTDQ